MPTRSTLLLVLQISSLVGLSQVHHAEAACCKEQFLLCVEPDVQSEDYIYRNGVSVCADCQSVIEGKYCGNGKCNMFGCSCDGGCRSIPETSSFDSNAIQNYCTVDACTKEGHDPYCGAKDYYVDPSSITPGTPLYSYCEAEKPCYSAFGGYTCSLVNWNDPVRRLLQATPNDTTTSTLTPYELCTQNLISELNTVSFTEKEAILANFKCLSMANPQSLKITKEEACTAVGEEMCANPEFDALFGEDNLAIPEVFDASLKGVDVTSGGSSLSGLASCVIAFILYIAL